MKYLLTTGDGRFLNFDMMRGWQLLPSDAWAYRFDSEVAAEAVRRFEGKRFGPRHIQPEPSTKPTNQYANDDVANIAAIEADRRVEDRGPWFYWDADPADPPPR